MIKSKIEARPKLCSICQTPFTGYGNNPEPVNGGRCCDDCNQNVVIPARINLMISNSKAKR